MNSVYSSRIKKLSAFLKVNSIAAAVFHDSEDCRDVNVRYLCGMPSDAILIVTSDEESILIPWDVILADKKASASRIIPYTDFDRDAFKTVRTILKAAGLPEGSVVELPSATTHLDFQKFSDELNFCRLSVTKTGAHDFVKKCRAVKDEYEIECTKKACSITDGMTEEIERMLLNGSLSNETQVALYIEQHLREYGCERTSFDTLAAGPERSFAIHAFPGYTAGAWGTQGLSILDYGVCYEGYASDCTLTIARGPLSDSQEELLSLVQAAADECLKLYAPGSSIRQAALKAEEIFAGAGKKMPHSLGHGTGLLIHEFPYVNTREDNTGVFVPGNIVTLEPGLYDEKLGGTRLENDILITETGNLKLTSSKIIRL